MRIKSFYANTVEGAVALARREMGADAMLVESRKAPLEARHLGEYEVVCALVPEADSARKPDHPEDSGVQDARLSRELAEMRRQLDVMGKTITRSAWSGARWSSAAPEMPEWHARLMATDMDGELVQQILDAAERRSAPELLGLEGAVAAREIAAIPGVTAIFAASGDLGNFSGYKQGTPDYERLINVVHDAALGAGKRLCGPFSWRDRPDFTCFQNGSETAAIARGVAAELGTLKDTQGKPEVGPYAGKQ